MAIRKVSKVPILPSDFGTTMLKQLTSVLTEHATAINGLAGIEKNGTMWYFGDDSPDSSLGDSGDFYFKSSADIYYKSDDGWALKQNINGADGEDGTDGTSTRIDQGTSSGTLNATYGNFGLYKCDLQTVTFATPFPSVPSLSLVPKTDGNFNSNPVSVILNTKSTTGFTWYATGMGNGYTITIDWEAKLSASGGGSGVTIGTSYASLCDYGSVDTTGSSDMTSVMQAAADTGKVITYPQGIIKCDTITLPNGGGIIGQGKGLTRIYTTSTTGNAISYTPALSSNKYGGLTFKSFELTSDDRASGAHIKVAPTGGYEIWEVEFFDVALWHTYTGFDIDNAAHWKITDCDVMNWHGNAVSVANNNNYDSGDSKISGCLFGNGRAAGAAIYQQSSGGLKVTGNKMNGGNYGYLMDLTAGAATSIFLFKGNSVENQGVAAMAFNVGSGGYFCFVTISGNEMALNPKGISINAIGSRLQSIGINNNQIAASNVAIEMAGGDQVLVACNTHIHGTNYAMSIGSGCTNGKAFGNFTSGTISNASSSFVIS